MTRNYRGPFENDTRRQSHLAGLRRLGLTNRHRSEEEKHFQIIYGLPEVKGGYLPGIVLHPTYGRLNRLSRLLNSVFRARRKLLLLASTALR